MSIPSNLYTGETVSINGNVNSTGATLPVTVQWSASNGGSFSNATPAHVSGNTNYTTDYTAPNTSGSNSITLSGSNCGPTISDTEFFNTCVQPISINITPISGSVNQNVLFQATINGGIDGNSVGTAVWEVGGQVITFSTPNISYNSQNYNIGGSGTNGLGFYQGVLMPSNPDTIPIRVTVTDCKGVPLSSAPLQFSFSNSSCVNITSAVIN